MSLFPYIFATQKFINFESIRIIFDNNLSTQLLYNCMTKVNYVCTIVSCILIFQILMNARSKMEGVHNCVITLLGLITVIVRMAIE